MINIFVNINEFNGYFKIDFRSIFLFKCVYNYSLSSKLISIYHFALCMCQKKIPSLFLYPSKRYLINYCKIA